jgi:Holliday junction DNA helicase RuvA
MISQLSGTLLEKQPPQLLLDVHGVGYEIEASMNTFYQLPDVGQQIVIYTHFVVREDAHLLFGFHKKDERTLFRTLIKVNGVGPKLGLTILSSISPSDFVSCIVSGDADALIRIPGVGKKTAERLIVEMRDKVSNWQCIDNTLSKNLHADTSIAGNSHTAQDAISALVTLGYKPQEASRIVAKVDNGALTSEELIRNALREMMT